MMSFTEIGLQLGCSRQRAKQIFDTGLGKLITNATDEDIMEIAQLLREAEEHDNIYDVMTEAMHQQSFDTDDLKGFWNEEHNWNSQELQLRSDINGTARTDCTTKIVYEQAKHGLIMKTLNLRMLRTFKTIPQVFAGRIGAPATMVKQEVSKILQWQTIEKVNGLFIDTDWQDVPVVDYDADTGEYVDPVS